MQKEQKKNEAKKNKTKGNEEIKKLKQKNINKETIRITEQTYLDL